MSNTHSRTSTPSKRLPRATREQAASGGHQDVQVYSMQDAEVRLEWRQNTRGSSWITDDSSDDALQRVDWPLKAPVEIGQQSHRYVSRGGGSARPKKHIHKIDMPSTGGLACAGTQESMQDASEQSQPPHDCKTCSPPMTPLSPAIGDRTLRSEAATHGETNDSVSVSGLSEIEQHPHVSPRDSDSVNSTTDASQAKLLDLVTQLQNEIQRETQERQILQQKIDALVSSPVLITPGGGTATKKGSGKRDSPHGSSWTALRSQLLRKGKMAELQYLMSASPTCRAEERVSEWEFQTGVLLAGVRDLPRFQLSEMFQSLGPGQDGRVRFDKIESAMRESPRKRLQFSKGGNEGKQHSPARKLTETRIRRTTLVPRTPPRNRRPQSPRVRRYSKMNLGQVLVASAATESSRSTSLDELTGIANDIAGLVPTTDSQLQAAQMHSVRDHTCLDDIAASIQSLANAHNNSVDSVESTDSLEFVMSGSESCANTDSELAFSESHAGVQTQSVSVQTQKVEVNQDLKLDRDARIDLMSLSTRQPLRGEFSFVLQSPPLDIQNSCEASQDGVQDGVHAARSLRSAHDGIANMSRHAKELLLNRLQRELDSNER